MAYCLDDTRVIAFALARRLLGTDDPGVASAVGELAGLFRGLCSFGHIGLENSPPGGFIACLRDGGEHGGSRGSESECGKCVRCVGASILRSSCDSNKCWVDRSEEEEKSSGGAEGHGHSDSGGSGRQVGTGLCSDGRRLGQVEVVDQGKEEVLVGEASHCFKGPCVSESVVDSGRRSKGQKKRDRLRRQDVRRRAVGADEVVSDETDESVVKGRCETVVSQVQTARVGTVGDSVPVWRRKGLASGGTPVVASASCQEAEQMARETLALRRAMENKVAVRKAELQLRSLNDEKKCQDYDDLKRQRIIQWQNQALAKSQSSARSLEPGSSVSMREFREKAKQCSDLEYKQQKTMRVVSDLYGSMAALKVLDAVEAAGEGTLMDQEAQDVCGDGGPEVWGYDVDEIGIC